MRDRQVTQLSEQTPVEPGNAFCPRAIILSENLRAPQTLGFPALNQTKPRRVAFSIPLHARCTSVDGLWAASCRVLSIWDVGAQIEASFPDDFTQFYLLFTPLPRLVSRLCKRVITRGSLIEVLYLRRQPTFLMSAGPD